MRSMPSEPFCGQVIYRDQISEIAVIADTFPKLSRTKLANTVCELFSWVRVKNLASSGCFPWRPERYLTIGSAVTVVDRS